MTSEEQEKLWVEGKSVHNDNKEVNVMKNGKVVRRIKLQGGECCPDFSCCQPALQWSKDLRETFHKADPATRRKMLGMALSASIDLAMRQRGDNRKVYITTGDECGNA